MYNKPYKDSKSCRNMMANRTIKVSGILLVVISLFFVNVSAFSGTGDGSSGNPYQITNWTTLNETRDNLTVNYILMNDLNSSMVDYEGLGNNWVPIGDCGVDNDCWNGDDSNYFSGVFNGNAKIISNLTIESSSLSGVGLFGAVTGDILNVGMTGVNISGLFEVIGGLVGWQASGSISNSYVVGNIEGQNYIGGLVGNAFGLINNSYSDVDVVGSEDVGGLVGDQTTGVIFNCYSTGSVSGSRWFGGLVGWQFDEATIINSYWDVQTSGIFEANGFGSGFSSAFMKSLQIYDSWNISYSPNDLNNGYPYLAWSASNNSYVWLSPGGFFNYEGDGSVENPYQINNWTQLSGVALNMSASYVLVKNLSSSTSDYEGIGDNWVPLGSDDGYGGGTHFLGIFDGQNNIISDLVIDLPSANYVGLFGYSEGEISNIGLINVNVSGLNSVGGLVGWQDGGFINNSYASGNIVSSDSSWWVGGLVGTQGDATIANSYFIGNVTSSSSIYVGGLVGESSGLIDYSYASADVTGFEWVGGLVGSQGSSTVNNSYATGNVNGSSYVGGLVGKQDYGGIYNSYATGNVFGEDSVGGLAGVGGWSVIENSYATGNVFGGGSAGGLAGDYDGGIYDSYATGDVNGTSAVGGLVGASGGGIDHSATVSGSYATGDVAGSGNWVGGLIGIQMHTYTSDCYATGSVIGSGDYVGGLVGWHTSMGSISNSYFIMSLAVRGNNYTGVLVGSVSSGSNVTDSYAIVDVAADFGGTENVGFIGLNNGLFSSSYLTLRNINYGNITFLTENVSGNIGSNSVNISSNFASVDSLLEPGLNKSANVSFLNVPVGKLNYTILKNGEVCLDCFNFTSLSGNVTFNVTSWSNYTIYYEEQPTCSDGIKNGGETGLDCGGSCGACSVTGRAVGSSGRSVPVVYALLDLQFGNRITKNLRGDDQVVFNVSNQSHKITLNSFNEQSANVTIESVPRDYIVKINEMVSADVNDDGINDISVSYLKYTGRFAQLEIVKLNLQGEVVDTNVVDQFIEKNQSGGKILFISSIVLLVLILLFFILFFIVLRRNR